MKQKNTKEELIAAAQERIDKYLGEEGKVTVSYNETSYDEIDGLHAADDTFLLTVKIGDKEKSFNIHLFH